MITDPTGNAGEEAAMEAYRLEGYEIVTRNYHSRYGEIDFIVQKDDQCIPVEVKAEENLMAKSLRAYCSKYHPETAVRTSMSNYREESWMTNVPLYMIGEYLSE